MRLALPSAVSPAVASLSLALALSAAPLFAQTAATDDVVLGALRIGSLQALATNAGVFANQIQPGSGAATAQLTAGAAMFGIDPTGEILALVIDPQKSAVPFAFVVTTVDPEALKANPALGFQSAGQPDRFQITVGGRPMFATFVDKRLVVSPLETGLDAILPAIRSGEDIRQLRATGGDLALSLSTARLYAAYKPMIDLMLGGMRGQFAKTLSASASGAPTANPADIFGSLLGSIGELQSVSLRIAIQADHVELRSLVEATAGTSTAKLLNPGRGLAVTTLGLHDASSALLGTISARPGPEFWQAYNELTATLLASSGVPASAETSRAFAKIVNDFATIWDGTASFGMLSPGKGLSGSGVAGITDQQKALALVRALPELQKDMAAINAAQGIKTETVFGATEDYHGAHLIDYTQTFEATDPAMQEGMAPLKALGMERMSATYAVTANSALYVMGDDTRAKAKALVDTTTPPPTTLSPATYGLPENTTAFVAISLPRYFGWIAGAGVLPINATAIPADLKPGLAMSADLDAGRADLRLHLTAAEIATFIGMFRAPATP